MLHVLDLVLIVVVLIGVLVESPKTVGLATARIRRK